eukprot:SAG11_NODE_7733_length_1103_cov_1.034861_2_plen_61_part_01
METVEDVRMQARVDKIATAFNDRNPPKRVRNAPPFVPGVDNCSTPMIRKGWYIAPEPNIAC